MRLFLKKFGHIVLACVLTLGVLLAPLTVQAAETTATVLPYQILVNRAANCVTVYAPDETGAYTIPVRSFACSCGRQDGSETPLGVYTTSDYYPWRLMVDGSYAQYAIRFNKGIMFHSVPYYTQSPDNMEKEQYNLLGDFASLGCVRLAASDVKWIYENCPQGTTVIVYDDAENPGPLGKPVTMQVSPEHPFAGWDPTDDNELNPWNLIKPSLYLKQDMGDGVLYMPVGSTLDDLKQYIGLQSAQGVTYDTATYHLYINGNYDLNTFGVYRIWITGEDYTGVMTQQEYILAVVYM